MVAIMLSLHKLKEEFQMEDCIFCKIAHHQIDSSIVYENEHVMAFDDINPVAPVHILVIPKNHVESLIQLEDNQKLAEIHKAIKEIAEVCGIDKSGFRLISNVGENGGQTVKHLHFHMIGGMKLPEKLA